MLTARQRFVELALSRLGGTVLWAAQGPDAFDCSGLVMWCLGRVGARGPSGKPLVDHNAQMLADELPALATAPGALPLPGDLCMYGQDAARVTHVAIWLAGGRVLSADGATSRVTELALAEANRAARVRLHDSPQYRRDFLGLYRNRFLDELDLVTR